MRRLLALLALVIAACASNPQPTGIIAASYETVKTYQRLVQTSVERGRISSAQAFRLIDDGEKVRAQVDKARDAFALCGGKLPCDSYEEIIKRVQPMLAELELRLREQEAKK